MKKILAALSLATLLAVSYVASATPQQDLEEFQSFYKERFPNTPFEDFVNGVYSIDAASREQWEEIEEFGPYELNITYFDALGDPAEGRFATALAYRDSQNCLSPTSIRPPGMTTSAPIAPLSAVDGRVHKSAWLENRILTQ